MKKYLFLIPVFCLVMSGCFVCRDARSPIKEEDYTTNKALAADPKAEKVVVEKVVEKVVKIKEKSEPAITISAKDAPVFETASDKLTTRGRENVKFTAKEIIKNYPESMILIVGHTDNVGEDAFNLVLSEARAKSVANELKANGVTNLIGIDGKGSSEPKVSNDTEEGRATNRRVEIFIRQ